ncbi:uncharacterized protein CEXT_37871 [Caerostris extrusa]|uniref:Uncharacterized protein n=1 Tax=Caerostris extrusa TaxID=172846 RepID=A0AAV4TXW6_CAEEX|nr:uncharacterized protein CEXT_37871 [Caerostris extrusa]
MATTFFVFIITIHALFMNVLATVEDEQDIQTLGKDLPASNQMSGTDVLKQLVNNFVSKRFKRSPQWRQSLLVQGLSQPFCTLFGGNTGCSQLPTPNVQTTPTQQCAIGFRYDYTSQRCRQMQNGK